MIILIVAVLVVLLLILASWWAGGWGIILCVFALVAAAGLFFKKADILSRLPQAATKILGWVLAISVGLLVFAGAKPRIEKYDAERKQRIEDNKPLGRRHTYIELSGSAFELKPGRNHIGFLPCEHGRCFSGCMVAPEGWYVSARAENPRDNGLYEFRANCGDGAEGVASTKHSSFLPKSVSIKYNGKEPNGALVYLTPIGQRPR